MFGQLVNAVKSIEVTDSGIKTALSFSQFINTVAGIVVIPEPISTDSRFLQLRKAFS